MAAAISLSRALAPTSATPTGSAPNAVRTNYQNAIHYENGDAICEIISSLPFGDGQTTTGPQYFTPCYNSSPLHFTGKERDSESGLDDFDARYYSSSMGRFMSPDWSATPESIPYADLSKPQSLNLYTYVEDNPLKSTDPDGHCEDAGEQHGFWWCLAHGLGLIYSKGDRINEATNFFNNNEVYLNRRRVDPSKETTDQLLKDWQEFNDQWRALVAGGANPANAMMAPGLVFEPAPYHGESGSGGKSPGPQDGQTALDNSVQVKETSPRRVGVDKAHNEIVVLDQTSPGKFHGHVRQWSELTSEMQNALKNAALTDARGNIK